MKMRSLLLSLWIRIGSKINITEEGGHRDTEKQNGM